METSAVLGPISPPALALLFLQPEVCCLNHLAPSETYFSAESGACLGQSCLIPPWTALCEICSLVGLLPAYTEPHRDQFSIVYLPASSTRPRCLSMSLEHINKGGMSEKKCQDRDGNTPYLAGSLNPMKASGVHSPALSHPCSGLHSGYQIGRTALPPLWLERWVWCMTWCGSPGNLPQPQKEQQRKAEAWSDLRGPGALSRLHAVSALSPQQSSEMCSWDNRRASILVVNLCCISWVGLENCVKGPPGCAHLKAIFQEENRTLLSCLSHARQFSLISQTLTLKILLGESGRVCLVGERWVDLRLCDGMASIGQKKWRHST